MTKITVISGLVASTLLLASCSLTPQGDAARAFVKDRGAEIYDQGIDNVIWFLCYGTSVGSVKRRFGTSPDRAVLYNRLCNIDGVLYAPILPPSEPETENGDGT